MKIGYGSRLFNRFSSSLALLATGLYTLAAPVRIQATETFAHRGGYFLAPENTCAAFRQCAGKTDGVEFDVHVTADGELVVIHDDTVNRTTSGYGPVTNVADLTLAELKTLDAGAPFSPYYAGERIPTLAEALRAVPSGLKILIHRKTGSPESILAAVRAENAVSNTTIYCDTLEFLDVVHQLEPGLPLCAGGGDNLGTNGLNAIKHRGFDYIGWATNYVTPEFVERVHSCGLKIQIATEGAQAMPYLDMGVDRLLVASPWLGKLLTDNTPSPPVQLARDLRAYWKLDDGLEEPFSLTNEDVESISAGRLFGYGSQPSWIAGPEARAGGALRFDGINDYVKIPTNAALNIGTNAVTLSLWVKLTTLPSALTNGYAAIYDDRDVDAYCMYLDRAAAELRFKVTDSATYAARPGIPEALLQTGVWHHVVGVFNGSASPVAGQALIFLDGRFVDLHTGGDWCGSRGLTNSVRPGQSAAIGRNGLENNYYFAGDVDDIAVWARGLSPAEIRQVYAAGTNGLPLEHSVMTLWISNVYPDPVTSEMHIDVCVDHGSLETNQTLRLRGANRANDSYIDRAPLTGGHGHASDYRIPAGAFSNGNGSGLAALDDTPAPSFFRVSMP